VMGIVNVTPDSFSDGGLYATPERAISHGLELVAEGADLLDVGGESTRPGSQPVPLADELARVVPVVAALVRQSGVPVSVDTSKSGCNRRRRSEWIIAASSLTRGSASAKRWHTTSNCSPTWSDSRLWAGRFVWAFRGRDS